MNLMKTMRNLLREQYTLRDNLVSFAIGATVATMILVPAKVVMAEESLSQGELAPSIVNETTDMGATQMDSIQLPIVTLSTEATILPNVTSDIKETTETLVSTNSDLEIIELASDGGTVEEIKQHSSNQADGPGVPKRNRITLYGTAGAKLYAEPNENSEVKSESNLNTTFLVYEDVQDGWYEVTTSDIMTTLWMKAENLQEKPWPEAPTYTEEDLYILAHVIAGEAQPYDDMEQRYVASVVMNRVNSPKFPNSIKGVVFQKGQYSCTRDGNYYREPTERNWANAKYILENGSLLPGNVVFQSGGRQGKGTYLKTKYHYYCY